MSPAVDPCAPSTLVPHHVDVLVIGGGIVGVSTALALARKGISVALCEKGRIGGEQSSRNWGWCRAMGRDRREIPLIQESLRMWRAMGENIGTDVGFRACGILYLCRSREDLAAYEPWIANAKAHGIDSRLIGRSGVEKLLPGLSYPVAGALYTASDGRAEPSRAAPAIAEAARRAGAHILTNCAVGSLETKAGRISGAITERGEIGCHTVVVAGGVWSRLFCGNLGVDLPLLKVLGSVLRTQPIPGGPEVSAGGHDFAFRRRADGGYTVSPGGLTTAEITPDNFRLFGAYLPVLRKEWKYLRPRIGRQFLTELRQQRHWDARAPSPFERARELDPQPDHALLDKALRALRSAHPAFAFAVEAERWGGYIDVTPDAVPVIAPVESRPGLYLATGFSGHGFGLGPGAGQLAADLVAGDTPGVDPSPFRFDRFSDPERMVLEVGLSVAARNNGAADASP